MFPTQTDELCIIIYCKLNNIRSYILKNKYKLNAHHELNKGPG